MKTTLIKTITIVLIAFFTNITTGFGQSIGSGSCTEFKLMNNKWVKVGCDEAIFGFDIDVPGRVFTYMGMDLKPEIYRITRVGVTYGRYGEEIPQYFTELGVITIVRSNNGTINLVITQPKKKFVFHTTSRYF
jgi:hypothetical protein